MRFTTVIQFNKQNFLLKKSSHYQEGHIKEVGSGKCLASLGARDRSPIVLDYCQNSPNQIWQFGR